MPTFFDDLNARYFEGGLSREVVLEMGDLPEDRSEARATIERFFAGMRTSGFRSRDFTPRLATFVGSTVPNILPSAWGGMIPPITVRDRHVLIDDYLSDNPWRDGGSASMLDIGCGFPPLTSVDSAAHLADWHIIGVDPVFDTYLVYDDEGAYAILADDGEVRYFQPGAVGDFERWSEMLTDADAVKERFRAIFARMSPRLTPGRDPETFEEEDGARLIRHPLHEYERPNLRFVKGGIGEVEVGAVDVVRCFNLLYYFDTDFRRSTEAWVEGRLEPGGLFICGGDGLRTTESRYSIYRKEQGGLVRREFAFSVDNVRPVCSMLPWYALHDEELETNELTRCVAMIRDDAEFARAFDDAMDRLLEERELYERDRHGYLVDLPMDPLEYTDRLADAVSALDRLGFVEDAAERLRTRGLDARRNRVGHVSVTPRESDR